MCERPIHTSRSLVPFTFAHMQMWVGDTQLRRGTRHGHGTGLHVRGRAHAQDISQHPCDGYHAIARSLCRSVEIVFSLEIHVRLTFFSALVALPRCRLHAHPRPRRATCAVLDAPRPLAVVYPPSTSTSGCESTVKSRSRCAR